MTKSYRVRLATRADVDTIVTHRRSMFLDMGGEDPERLDAMAAGSRPWLDQKMSTGDYIGWLVVAQDGSIAGSAGLWIIEWPPTMADLSGRRAMLLSVYTEAAHRRHGIARELTKTALDWCRAKSITVVILHASDTGRRVYEEFGFRPTNEMRLLLEK